MRILIVSDVHGNWEALRAVLTESHDRVMFLGDAVDFGPEPQPCVDALRTAVSWAVRGNHDHGIAFGTSCRCFGPWQAWDEATRLHTLRMLSDDDRLYLRLLPLRCLVKIDDVRFGLVHAAPTDPLYRYLPADIPDIDLAGELGQINADVLLVGHTHVAMMRRVGSRLVVNPGSAGMPRGADASARYAVWEDGRVELCHVAYNVEATVRRLRALDLPDAVCEGIASVLRGEPYQGAVSGAAESLPRLWGG